MQVLRANGIHLPECDVWMDSLRSRSLGVVTHAHSDHAAWHETTILTPATASLMRARRGCRNKTVHELPYLSAFEAPSSRITLLPAGHVLGSSQVFVETESGTMLYTGDFKLRRSLTSEQAVSVEADTLVIECTFGLPRYRFPSAGQTHEQIVDFCRACLDSGCLPVLLAYSIGKAQELLALMRLAGLEVVLHNSVHKMALVYESHGVAFANFIEWDGENHEGRVMIFPPNIRDQLAHLTNAKYAIVSGWAMDKSAIYRYGCDAAFPLSDHADYDELLEHVARVRPRRVFAVHGFVEEFARDLRQLGVDALALGGKNQLEFLF